MSVSLKTACPRAIRQGRSTHAPGAQRDSDEETQDQKDARHVPHRHPIIVLLCLGDRHAGGVVFEEELRLGVQGAVLSQLKRRLRVIFRGVRVGFGEGDRTEQTEENGREGLFGTGGGGVFFSRV